MPPRAFTFNVKNKILTITASDLETAISTVKACYTVEPGDIKFLGVIK